MYLEQFFIEGLGCASYLIGCEGAGVAAVVDPDREVDKYLRAAAARGLTITHIIETHLHADHVSGNTGLQARTGADIYVHESAGAEFEHKPLREGDALLLGNVQLTVRHTPGHSPGSVSFVSPGVILGGDVLFSG